MFYLFLAMVQVTGAAPSDSIDLTVSQQCKSKDSANDEIIVCGRRGESPYRLKELPRSGPPIPKAGLKLADGVQATAEAEGADVGGYPSKRAMVRLNIKF